MNRSAGVVVPPDFQAIQRHLSVDRYGEFLLSPAIRPSIDLQVVPREGYRMEIFEDGASGGKIPMLAAAVSYERLFDVFLELLARVGEDVDCILQSHHQRRGKDAASRDFLREHIDLPVLVSHLCDFEEMFLGDGCLGVAVIDPAGPSEIQLDDHKLLVVYSQRIDVFEGVFQEFGLPRDDDMLLISEGEHLHSTIAQFGDQLATLREILGAQPVE